MGGAHTEGTQKSGDPSLGSEWSIPEFLVIYQPGVGNGCHSVLGN